MTYIVPNFGEVNPIWSIKKGETIRQSYDLSPLAVRKFSSEAANSVGGFDDFDEGKYKVKVVLQIFEQNTNETVSYESDIFINLFKGNNKSAGEPTDADETLIGAMLFVVGQTNKNRISAEEMALRELLTQRYAVSSFKFIIRHGTPEGKLYGLLGLKLLRYDYFDEQLEYVRKNIKSEIRVDKLVKIPVGKVRVQSGCEVGFEDSLEVVRQIADGKYDSILENKVDEAGRIVY